MILFRLSRLPITSGRLKCAPASFQRLMATATTTHPQPDEGGAAPAPVASISDRPRAGQLVEHEGKKYTTIKEGLAYILIPPTVRLQQRPTSKQSPDEIEQSVFYNPIQQYNRDLTVAAIRTFGEDWVATRQLNREKWFHKKAKQLEKKQNAATGNKGNASQEITAVSQASKQDSSEVPVAAGEITESERGQQKRKLEESDGLNDAKRQKTDARHIATDKKFNGLVSSTQEDVDESFGDGGIPDELFLDAEKSFGSGVTVSPVSAEKSRDALRNNPRDIPNQSDEERSKIPFRILDALSATGLRALRYAHEIPFATSITANDLSNDAVESIKLNLQHNALPTPSLVRATAGNAVAHMNTLVARGHSHEPKYSVIDLDPYGTAVPFLDSAIQALADDGLLCVTCTDTSIFNSMGYLEKCFSQYGGLPVKGDFCHEAGLRLILQSISTTAAKYGLSMEPLLSLSIDYYARVFVRIRHSPAEVKFHGSKSMIVYSCDSGCGAWTKQSFIRSQVYANKKGDKQFKHSAAQGPTTNTLCEHCGNKTHVAGPMYGGPLHNPSFVQRLLENVEALDPDVYKTVNRMKGMLAGALEETDMYELGPLANGTQQGKAADEEMDEDAPAGNEVPTPRSSARFNRLCPEVKDDHPFYFIPDSLSRVLRCTMPSAKQLRGALRHLGYRAVRSHAKSGSIKTDAPYSVLWDIMREWLKTTGQTPKSLTPTSPGWKILNSPPKSREADVEWEEVLTETDELKVECVPGSGWKVLKRKAIEPMDIDGKDEEQPKIIFDETLGSKEKYPYIKLRYQGNQRENWGPMAKAKGKK